ncbi:hypothetical protein LR48_Vigan08g072700 [Vigna angularis]|uniref:Major facilitator superfamily (MFS) profile domain-containing protein n=1 Tax=Phaseolus angularis TaxID=3914 RepID=A0A0L9V4B4_PHAAN|nr:hypothetical protein LR48_Vigan08g072700 [Vigna angularis]
MTLRRLFEWQFASSKMQDLTYMELTKIKLRNDEDLRDFMDRYNRTARQVKGVVKEFIINTLSTNLREHSKRTPSVDCSVHGEEHFSSSHSSLFNLGNVPSEVLVLTIWCSLSPKHFRPRKRSNLTPSVDCSVLNEERFSNSHSSLFHQGNVPGAGTFGHLSDSVLGRKGSLTVVCALNTIFGTLTAFSPSYSFYIFFRFLTGCSTGGVGLCAFVLATEPVGPSSRGTTGMCTFYFFSSGIAMLSVIAYIFPTWRKLYIASSIPSLLFLLFILPFISESPRWYLIRGRKSEAMKVITAMATTNGTHIPKGVRLILDHQSPQLPPPPLSSLSCNSIQEQVLAEVNSLSESQNQEKLVSDSILLGSPKGSTCHAAVAGSLIDVIRSPMTRSRLILAVVINFLCSVVYYGLSLNVVNLETNLYLTVILNAVAEMPAFMITAIFLDRWGRKPLTIATLWFSGLFCFAGSLARNVGVWKGVRMMCGILGIFGMAGTYNLLFIYTAELFPTVVRNAALGCATQAAQMGAILAPLVVVIGGSFPFMIFALCGLGGGFFAFYLPETLNQPLYDTLTGMEATENSVTSSIV